MTRQNSPGFFKSTLFLTMEIIMIIAVSLAILSQLILVVIVMVQQIKHLKKTLCSKKSKKTTKPESDNEIKIKDDITERKSLVSGSRQNAKPVTINPAKRNSQTVGEVKNKVSIKKMSMTPRARARAISKNEVKMRSSNLQAFVNKGVTPEVKDPSKGRKKGKKKYESKKSKKELGTLKDLSKKKRQNSDESLNGLASGGITPRTPFMKMRQNARSRVKG